MKACIIQPPYYTDYSRSDECFQWELEALDKCDESMDLIVLPESADVPCLPSSQEERSESLRKYNQAILEKAGFVVKERRYRENGGNSSNIYYLA